MNTRFATPLKATLLAAALVAGIAPAVAEAYPRGRVSVWVGGPFWWGPGYWGPPVVVERPVVVQQPVEPLIVQPSAAQQTHLWYYCRDSQMYYPYVSSCASPWQEVPATPAPAAPTAPAAQATPAATPAAPATPAPAAAPSRTAPAPVPPAPGSR